MALLNGVGAIPHPALAPLASLANFLIFMVLGAFSPSVDLRAMTRLGARPITIGLLVAGVMGIRNLGLIHALAIS